MKKRLLWVLVVTVWGSLLSQAANAEEKPICAPAGSNTESKIGAAKIAAVQGKVEAKRTSEDKWHAAKRNAIYCPGDQIRVGKDSRASIILSNDTLVRLDQYSAITLTKIETEGPSLLELVKGIAHFISRVPRSLKVDTPFVNAAIEGTEFVVAVKDNDTTVTVFEGIVLTENENGSVRLLQNESSITKQGQAPEKILLAKPRDTVQWALYFPPVIKADAEGNSLQQASSLLYKGRVSEASALLADIENNGEAKSLQAIIAIVNNDKENAFNLAKDAVQLAPDSAAPHIAMSYAWQAQLNLSQALASAKQATNKAPDDAIAWSRLAELQLSVGQLSNAQESATRASELDNSIARTQTILAYAYLTQIDISQARATFNKAIELDQNDPLPHLGLGLAMIRQNELAAGRREIEIAASLDPNNAIIRSYLGKAYYEEKRGPLDAEQFAMAKELDPNDPTPYYYDAIRKQTENNPVGALEDLNKSIELNDNRAVYRSSLQLDQDEAARSASFARIYQDLGFEQTAVNVATKSLSSDPTNHSAHRLLADAYSKRQRHEIAHASELFQAKMLQPIGLTTLQPQSVESDLNTLSYANSFGSSSSDFSNLFTSDSSVANLNLFAGNHNTRGDELMVAGLYDNFAISAAQYSYQSDGFRSNNDEEHELYDLFIQSQLSNNLSIQAEYLHRATDEGDLDLLFDPNSFTAGKRNDIERDTSRLGLNYKLNTKNTFLASYIYGDVENQEQTTAQTSPPVVIITTTTDRITESSRTGELQHILGTPDFSLSSGVIYIDANRDFIATTRTQIPLVNFDQTVVDLVSVLDKLHYSVYSYAQWQILNSLELNLGLSYDNYQAEQYNNSEIDRLNPKFGLRIKPWANTEFRLASFQLVNRPILSNQTLEPTQIAGFNQYFADLNGSKITQHNLGMDISASKDITLGISSIYREIDAPQFQSGNIVFDNLKELNHQLYMNWSFNRYSSLSIAAIYEGFENLDNVSINTPKKLKTVMYPLKLSLRLPTGFSFSLVPTYVDHDYIDSSYNNNHDSFTVTDLAVGYKFPKRGGSLLIGAHNLFDEQFGYYNLNYTGENNAPRFIPSRSYIVQLNITLP